jgi:hypothetical protein
MHQLEAALAAAAARREQAWSNRREQAWSNEVRRTLGILGEAAREERRTRPSPTVCCLISSATAMAAQQGRGLKIHFRQLRDATAARQHELDAAADQAVDFTDVRQRLAWVLAGLRHQRARESDLLHEAYYDAPFGPTFSGTPLTSYPGR